MKYFLSILALALAATAAALWSRTAAPSAGDAGRSSCSGYRTVAEHLALELKQDLNAALPQDFAEILAEARAANMDLLAVKSGDRELDQVAADGAAAFGELILHLERLQALPAPESAGSVFVGSFFRGLAQDLPGAAELGTRSEDRQRARLDEAVALFAAIERIAAARLLLPKIAVRHAAPPTSAGGRIEVAYAAAWQSWGSDDQCVLENRGAELEDCTVVVELKGASGETRRNVHFVRRWPAQTQLYARYSQGVEIAGRRVERRTVEDLETVEVSVLSPRYSTTLRYACRGAEHDGHVEECCRDLKMGWRYQPFARGLFSDDQRGIALTLNGGSLPHGAEVVVSFEPRDSASVAKSWTWQVERWDAGEERTFASPAGELLFDPSKVMVELRFAGTGHRPRWEFDLDR